MEFQNLGDHCEFSECRRLDFLPFQCDGCARTFCLSHRSYSAHFCPSGGREDQMVITCPLCRENIRMKSSEDPNEAFDLHARSGCNSENYHKKKKKEKCSAEGCRTTLGPSNATTCKECRAKLCLSHRLPTQHNCPGKKAAASTGFLQSFQARVRGETASSSSSRRPAPSSASTQRRESPSPSLPTRPSQQPGTRASTRSEVCPTCGASFPDIVSLIQHAETAHPPLPPPAPSNQQGASGAEICPICSARFPDITALIQHSEAQHNSEKPKGILGVISSFFS